MNGYKIFNEDWTCQGFQFEVGKTYEIDEKPICGEVGFYFYRTILHAFKFYELDPKNKVAIIEALGDIDDKSLEHYTNKIKIVKELSWFEVLSLLNIGIDNEGRGNYGDFNSGNYNSGSYNKGDLNAGLYNLGNCNSGSSNLGRANSGNYNTGDFNSGWRNSGIYNSGHWNLGSYNSGSYNIGDDNSGNYNEGHQNAGYFNVGECNAGDHNLGNYNVGEYNLGNYNTGCFNIKTNKMFMFNKPSDLTYEEWLESKAHKVLNTMPYTKVTWIMKDKMTDEEKNDHPEYTTTGGYLKKIIATDKDKQEWFDSLDQSDKKAILEIPNFDPEIFKEITGIDVTNS